MLPLDVADVSVFRFLFLSILIYFNVYANPPKHAA